jgi:hypothetical protein
VTLEDAQLCQVFVCGQPSTDDDSIPWSAGGATKPTQPTQPTQRGRSCRDTNAPRYNQTTHSALLPAEETWPWTDENSTIRYLDLQEPSGRLKKAMRTTQRSSFQGSLTHSGRASCSYSTRPVGNCLRAAGGSQVSECWGYVIEIQ